MGTFTLKNAAKLVVLHIECGGIPVLARLSKPTGCKGSSVECECWSDAHIGRGLVATKV